MVQKNILLIGVLIACCVSPPTSAYSDQFQVRDKKSGTPIGSLKLGVGGQVFYTDYQGRVIIDLARGAYTVDLTYRGSARKIPIQVDGAQFLKPIELD
jgi:hypothetical protein